MNKNQLKLIYSFRILELILINLLIFFVYPSRKGSEENQFTPLWGRG